LYALIAFQRFEKERKQKRGPGVGPPGATRCLKWEGEGSETIPSV
jgi:hypothetical protein